MAHLRHGVVTSNCKQTSWDYWFVAQELKFKVSLSGWFLLNLKIGLSRSISCIRRQNCVCRNRDDQSYFYEDSLLPREACLKHPIIPKPPPTTPIINKYREFRSCHGGPLKKDVRDMEGLTGFRGLCCGRTEGKASKADPQFDFRTIYLKGNF